MYLYQAEHESNLTQVSDNTEVIENNGVCTN